MSSKWRVGDLIDLEYFLQQEEDMAEENLHEDRNIYLNHLKGEGREKSNTLSFRQVLFKNWLENRKKNLKLEKNENFLMPGEIFEEVYKIFLFIFTVVGVLLGVTATFHLLSYDGSKPVNVTSYIGLFVLCQILLVIIIIAISLIKGKNRGFFKGSIFYRTVANLISKAINLLGRKTFKVLSQEKRSEVEAAIGIIKGKQTIYGHIFFWPVFILIQIGSIGFNLGVIGTTLVRILAQDLAFGWESTIQFSSQTVYNFVKIISRPWSWFVPPEIAFPSLTEIEGSKILLKNGIYHLSTQDLVSWWPFLFFSVLFYGFFPRLILLFFGVVKKIKALNELKFDTAACEKLILKMKTPEIQTRGKEEFPEIIKEHNQQQKTASVDLNENLDQEVSGASLLIPTDIYEKHIITNLNEVVEKRLHVNIIEENEIGIDPSSDSQVIHRIAGSMGKNEVSNIVLIQEAWQPPILEVEMLIEEIRHKVGKNVKIIVMLMGKPKAGDIFTPVDSQDQKLWEKFIAKIGDPYMWVKAIG